MFLTILVFILILGLLVFIHELGHFVVAKRNGVRVDEFGFGLPPRVFGIKRGETIYSLNALPIGGFVKIHGEDGEEKKDPRSFGSKKISQRAAILFAGVFMNFVLAVIFFGAVHYIGFPTALNEEEIDNFPQAHLEIIGIAPNSPAALAGIEPADKIIALSNPVDGSKIENIKRVVQFREFADANRGKEIIVSVQRQDAALEFKIIPREDPPVGEGALGVELVSVAKVSYPWWQAPWQGFLTTINLSGVIFITFAEIIKNLFISGKAGIEVAGPVGIFNITAQAAKLGFVYIVQLTALLSINLAIINALPFPALDGGRLLFLAIEKIKGSPVSQKVERVTNTVGFALLIALMVLITIKDLTRIF
ncbi:MAG: RIP metalloprotease RseP [Candidatus Portnoybacteria bacterium]|nr:RIP metalloprotease RseP [Candidatus Portnoybacteria bacterium]